MAIKVFCCYAREDETFLSKLRTYLKPLQRSGLIEIWYDGEISAGTRWEAEIHEQLNMAQVILLLVSPHFIDSDYCYDVEMKEAVKRHEKGEVCVIPVILSPVHWQETPFGQLQALPRNAKPLTSWRNRDEAIFNVVDGIREAVRKLNTSIGINTAEDDIAEIDTLKRPDSIKESSSYPAIAGNYKGSAFNKLVNENVDITIKVEQVRENISGYLETLTSAWIGSGPFEGTIDIDGRIKMRLKSVDSDLEILGEGILNADNSIRGIYTVEGSPDLGTWHVKRI